MEFSAQMARDWNQMETADEGVSPALLDETTRGAGSDSPAAGGGRGAELDPVIPTELAAGVRNWSWGSPSRRQ